MQNRKKQEYARCCMPNSQLRNLCSIVVVLLVLVVGTVPRTRNSMAGAATEAATQEATRSVADLIKGKSTEGKIMISARSETAAAVIDGLIYVPGGYGNERALEVYNPTQDSWRSLAQMPEGRNHLMTTAHKGRVYVFGGS